MKTEYTTSGTITLAAAWLCLVLTTALAPTANAKDALPEVSSEGLHLKSDAKVKIAYVKPGVSFADFDKLVLLDCYVEFTDDWQRSYNLQEIGLSGRIKDKDMEKIKEAVADEFRKVFTTELADKGGYEIVDEAGPGVLILRPAIINLDPTAPDVTLSTHRTIVDSAGSMTLYMELYDGANNEIIARVADPRQDKFGGLANRMTNRQAADRILRHWAKLLRDALGDVR